MSRQSSCWSAVPYQLELLTKVTSNLVAARDLSPNLKVSVGQLGSIVAGGPDSLYSLLNLLPIGVSICTDLSCREIRHNLVAARFLRIEGQEFSSDWGKERPLAAMFWEGQLVSPEAMPIQRCIRSGDHIRDMEIEFIWEDGVWKVALFSAWPLRNEHGAIMGAVSILEEVTERQQRRNAWRDCQECLEEMAIDKIDKIKKFNHKLRLIRERRETMQALISERQRLAQRNLEIDDILDSIADGFYILDKDLRFVYFNQATERILGLSREDLMGLTFEEAFPDAAASTLEELRLALDQKTPRHFEVMPLELGAWFEVNLYPTKENLSVFFRDITERKQSEEALRQSEERFYKAFHSSPVMMAIVNKEDCRCVDVNEKVLEVIERSREETVGCTVRELLTLDLEQGRQIATELIDKGKIEDMECSIRSRSGRLVTVRASTEIISLDGKDCYLCTMQDITKKKKYEAAIAMEEDRSRFLRIAAHELRNPLTGIRGISSLMRLRMASRKSLADLPRILEAEIDRLSALLDQVMDAFATSKGELPLKPEPLDLAAVISDALEGFIGLETHRVEFIKDGSCIILGDCLKLRQVFVNLISNAIKYSSSGTRVAVSLAVQENKAVITVKDEGRGIPEEWMEKIFEEFSRHNTSSLADPGGLGLGLFISRNIVTRHGGKVWARNNQAKGVTFFVELPLLLTTVA